MFKKLVLLFLLVLSSVFISYAEDTSVCGKSYMLTIDHELYILKFNSASFGPDCGGTTTFYWSDQKKEYNFQTQDIFFIKIINFGDFILKSNKLIYMDPKAITLTEY
jgi:hypothetical protein